MEQSIVIISIAFCIVNWIFYGSGHYYLNFINKEKYQVHKAISIGFTVFFSLVMVILDVTSCFLEIEYLVTILIIFLSIDFFGTVLYIIILDIIGLRIRNSEIQEILLDYINKKNGNIKEKSITDIYTKCRNYPRDIVEKIYAKLLKNNKNT